MAVPLVRLLDCGVCYQPFDKLLHKPMLTTCGHALCHNCRHNLMSNTKIPCQFCEMKEPTEECYNCRQIACPFCRHPRALQVPIYDYLLLDQMEELKREAEVLDRDTKFLPIRTHWEKRQLAVEMAKLRELEEKNREMEKEKLRLLEEAAEEAKTRCSSCQKTGFSDRDLRLCLACTDPFLLRQTEDSVILTNMDQGRQVAVCSFCFVTSNHRNHKNLSMLQLTRLARFEEYTVELMGALGNPSVAQKRGEIKKLKLDYMRNDSDEEQKNILNNLEVIMREQIPTVYTLE